MKSPSCYLLLVLLLALTACAPNSISALQTAAPSVEPTAAGTSTLTPTPTETPLPAQTLTPTVPPTETSAPTATVTPTPQLSLCQTKPTSLPEKGGKLRVAAVRDGDLWIWTEGDTNPAKITETGDVKGARLSPDGTLAAFERQVGKSEEEIWVIGADGKGLRRLASPDELSAMGDYDLAYHVLPHNLTWIPGTHVLAFNTFPVLAQEQLYAADDLWTIDAGTGEANNLLPHNKGGEFVFSPDGTQIALMTPFTLSLIKTDGTDLRWNLIKNYRAVDMGGAYFYPLPAWAPDSQSLRVGVPSPVNAVDPHPPIQVWDIPLRGFYLTKVATIDAFPPSLAFSPDLNLLAYITWPDLQSGRRQLNLAALTNGSAQSALYEEGGRLEFLGWAPDSRRFAFWIPAARKLELGDACGVSTPLAAEQTDYGSVRWVDEERFLFVTGTPGKWELLRGVLGGDSTWVMTLGSDVEYDFVVAKTQ